ncbi:MAG: hypothetical protein JST66_08950 [Bacteroidetes bacterium]|nr:hypothetical protein [Bacteroidota bacterium]
MKTMCTRPRWAICALVLGLLLTSLKGWAQPWTYDFGTGTGTANNANSGSGNTAFFTGTPANGGTYRVRIGTAGGSLILANPGTTLGSGTEAQLVAATSTATNKFGIYDWNAPSTVSYARFKLRTTSSGNGNLAIALGINIMANDNQGFTSHYNNSLAIFSIRYTSGAISSVVRRSLGSDVTVTSSGFLKDTDQQVEIYGNNGGSAASYYKGGTSYSLSSQQWDLWVDGTKISPAGGWSKGNTLASGTLTGIGFFGETSTGNAAVMYLDDLDYSNALPVAPSISAPSPSSLTGFSTTQGTPSAAQQFTVSGSNLGANLVVTAPAEFEVRDAAAAGAYASSVSFTPSGGTVSTKTIDVRLTGTNIGTFTGTNVVVSSTGATSQNVAVDGTVVASGTPTVTVNYTAPGLGFGNICTNATSSGQTFTISGSTLTSADVTVGPLSGYLFQDVTGGGSYLSSLSIAQPGGSFSRTISVELAPTAVQSYDGNVPVGGGGASTVNVPVTGSGVNTAPAVTTGSASSITTTGATLAGTITSAGCTSVTAYGIEYSTTNGFANGAGTQVPSSNLSGGAFSSAVSGLSGCTTYYFKAYATNGGGTAYGSQGSFTTSDVSVPVATAATGVGTGDFIAHWDPAVGATGYRLDVATTSSFNATNTVLSSDFESGTLTGWTQGTAGHWAASNSAPLTGGFSAKHNLSGVAGTSYLYAQPTAYDLTAGTTTWQLNLRPGFAPSTNNKCWFYLVASQSNLAGTTGLNGYVVGVNFTGSDDLLKLWKATNGAVDGAAIVSSGLTVAQNTTIGIEVTRSAAGLWTLKYKSGGGFTGMTTGGTGTDATYTTSTYAGLVFAYSSSNAGALRMDDVTITANTVTTLPGYNDLAVAGTSQPVTGLNSGTTYYYRVRAVGGNCTSVHSNVIDVTTTTPCTPVAITNTTSNSPICAGGTLNLGVTVSGTGPFLYEWTGTSTITNGDQANATVTGAATGNYHIVVVNDCGDDEADVAVVVNTPTLWYADADGDGFGDPAVSQSACAQPPGYVADNTDGCPADPAKAAPGACGCGTADIATTYYADTDGDGAGDPSAPLAGFTCTVPPGYVANNTDGCPTDPAKVVPGACGCGTADTDTDGDGTPDCIDGCVNDPGKIAPGACGCGTPDTDTDGDSTPDCFDGCPNDPAKTAPGACGCGTADIATTYYADTDGDGAGDPASPLAGFTSTVPPG